MFPVKNNQNTKFINMPAFDESKYRVGMKLGQQLVVRASSVFDITGWHKFDPTVFSIPSSELLLVRFEYCIPCSKAKSFIKVKGEELDYVQKTLSEQPIPHIERFMNNPELFRDNFKSLLIENYKKLKDKS